VNLATFVYSPDSKIKFSTRAYGISNLSLNRRDQVKILSHIKEIQMNSEKSALKFGFFTSVSLVVLTIATWGLGMIAIPPAGPYCPGNCMEYPFADLLAYYPRDYYWMYLSIFQLFAWLMFMSTHHHLAPVRKKLFSLISFSFALISATVLLLAYFVQFSVVPASMMKGETDGIAILTQYNGHGLFIAMEELGYITMAFSFLFLSFVFSRKAGLERALRLILLLSFVITAGFFLFYLVSYCIDRSYRFEVAAISINWLTIIVSGILAAIFFKRQLNAGEKE